MDFQNNFENLSIPQTVQFAPVDFPQAHDNIDQDQEEETYENTVIPRSMLFEAQELLKLEAALRQQEEEAQRQRELENKKKEAIQKRRTISFYPGQLSHDMRSKLSEAKKVYDHVYQRDKEKYDKYVYFHPKTLSGHYFDVSTRGNLKRAQSLKKKSGQKPTKATPKTPSVQKTQSRVLSTRSIRKRKISPKKQANKENEFSAEQREKILSLVETQKSESRSRSRSRSKKNKKRVLSIKPKKDTLKESKPLTTVEFEKRIEKIIQHEILQFAKKIAKVEAQDAHDKKELVKTASKPENSFKQAIRVYSNDNTKSVKTPKKTRSASPKVKDHSPPIRQIASPHQIELIDVDEYPTRENGEQNINDIREHDQKKQTIETLKKTQPKSFKEAKPLEQTQKHFDPPKSATKTDQPGLKSILKNARPQSAGNLQALVPALEKRQETSKQSKVIKPELPKTPVETKKEKKSEKEIKGFGARARQKIFTVAKLNSRGYKRYIKEKADGFVEIILDDLVKEVIEILNEEEERMKNELIRKEKEAIIHRCIEELKEINLQQTLMEKKALELEQVAQEEERKLQQHERNLEYKPRQKKKEAWLDGVRYLTLDYDFIDEKNKYRDEYNKVKIKDKLLSDKTLIKIDFVVKDLEEELLDQITEEFWNIQDNLVEKVFKEEFEM